VTRANLQTHHHGTALFDKGPGLNRAARPPQNRLQKTSPPAIARWPKYFCSISVGAGPDSGKGNKACSRSGLRTSQTALQQHGGPAVLCMTVSSRHVRVQSHRCAGPCGLSWRSVDMSCAVGPIATGHASGVPSCDVAGVPRRILRATSCVRTSSCRRPPVQQMRA